jgi:hypothetical protein
MTERVQLGLEYNTNHRFFHHQQQTHVSSGNPTWDRATSSFVGVRLHFTVCVNDKSGGKNIIMTIKIQTRDVGALAQCSSRRTATSQRLAAP